MTTLIKKTKLVYTPAVAGSPGDPGSPPTPGYYVDLIPAPGPRWVLIVNGRVVGESYFVEPPIPINLATGNTSSGPTKWTPVPPRPATKMWIPPTAGRAPTPTVIGTAAKTETNFNIGWNAGAVSQTTRSGEVVLSLKASPSSVGIVSGLNQAYSGNDYKRIRHGFYFTNGKAIVYEQGVQKTVAVNFVAADEFQVRRASGVVSYYKGDELLYTSAISSTGSVFADAAMYVAGDAITAAAFTAGAASNPGETKDADAISRFLPAGCLSSDYSYTSAVSKIGPLASSGADNDDELRPSYTAAVSEFLPLLSFAVMESGKVGQVEARFVPFGSLSSDGDYTEARSTFQPMQSFALAIPPLGNHADIELPFPELVSDGHESTDENNVAYSLPFPTLAAHAGGFSVIKLPGFTLEITATQQGWGNARLSLPFPELSASASRGYIAQANITPNLEFLASGYAGAVCAITVHGATLQASSSWRQLSGATATLPLFELTASASTQQTTGALIELPVPYMVQRSAAWLIVPTATLTAIGSAVVAVNYEAYNINLSHQNPEANNEVTRYTNFPFDRIVRYQGSYFGVAADGLYLLEGTTDDGAVIPYSFKTCIDDFKKAEKKTVASAYFGGRLGPGATIKLYAGETGAESYEYTTPRGQGAQNYREKFGRGVKDRYFAIAVSGNDAMRLDELELEVNVMTRRI